MGPMMIGLWRPIHVLFIYGKKIKGMHALYLQSTSPRRSRFSSRLKGRIDGKIPLDGEAEQSCRGADKDRCYL